MPASRWWHLTSSPTLWPLESGASVVQPLLVTDAVCVPQFPSHRSACVRSVDRTFACQSGASRAVRGF